MISKKQLKEHLDRLPEEFTIEQLIEQLIFLEKVETGFHQSATGQTITEQELNLKMKSWFK